MAEVSIGIELFKIYQQTLANLPDFVGKFFNFLILVLLVVLYSIFVWKFYKFISKKNILELDLKKYNTSSNPFFTKIIAGAFYLLEYIVILPFLIFFWFAAFSLFSIFLTENLDTSSILFVSATIVAAIRMTAYYKQDLSRDIAKLLPFTLLAVTLLTPGFFNIERIFTQFSEIPQLLGSIASYLVFIIFLEVILRLFDFVFSLFGLEETDESEEEK